MNILLPAAAAKDGRIEELVQQHHADRVKMHELHEKTSSFDTELAGLRSQLSHEQAHRQRLEARLRQLMSTPDFAAEGLGGKVLLYMFLGCYS
jgi:chromosome segregation ATPase